MSNVRRFEFRGSKRPPRGDAAGGLASGALPRVTRLVLAHKRIVVLVWSALAGVGFAILPTVTNHFSKGVSAPGRESYVVNQTVLKRFGGDGNVSPLVAVVQLPQGVRVTSPNVRAQLGTAFATLQRAEPSARVVSYTSTGSSAFVSADGRTTFGLIYPSLKTGGVGGGDGEGQGLEAASPPLKVAGVPGQITGNAAFQSGGGGSRGPGVLVPARLGALRALSL